MSELVRTYVERNISGSWSDISAFVVDDVEIEYLIPSISDKDLISSVGQFRFTMDNGDGSFSPSPIFRRGVPIRIRTVYDDVSKTRFTGVILDIDPDTLEWGDQYVRVTAVDWMWYALNFPMDIPQIKQNTIVDHAVDYLLSLMDVQPESVMYNQGREIFDFVFDTSRKETTVFSELNKLALSEYAPIYVRAGNVLVVESANTRHGMRELTKVPVIKDDLEAILTDPNGNNILVAEGTTFAILADRTVVPNLASGTHQPMEIELERQPTLQNIVTITSYPTRTDASPVKLFQLDGSIVIPTRSKVVIKSVWANPDGGTYINASDYVLPLVTGTHYKFYASTPSGIGAGSEISEKLLILSHASAKGHVHQVFNTGETGLLTQFDVYAKGIYPYNPVETQQGVTGSFNTLSVYELKLDQKYQDDFNVSDRLAETLVEDNKDLRNRLLSATFDASLDPELMQASQYMDIGDLTWITNVKPALDTYAYLRGKKTIISLAGYVTEKWYLKEMDSLRKGLTPVVLYYRSPAGAQNAVNFGAHPVHGSGGKHTWTCWFYMITAPTATSLISKTDEAETGTNANDLFIAPGALYNYQCIMTRRAFDDGSAGVWQSASGTLVGLEDAWHHVAMTYDDSSTNNSPLIYLDGVSLPLEATASIGGSAVDYSRANLILGNINIPTQQYPYNFSGYIKDARIYNRILSDKEVKILASDDNGYLLVPDGLVFQAPTVKNEDFISTGAILYPYDKIVDNIYGIRGTPNWNLVSGTGYELKYYNQNQP